MRYDNTDWTAVAVVGIVAVAISVAVIVGMHWSYQRDMAAIEKGLCQQPTVGSSTVIWTTCPAK